MELLNEIMYLRREVNSIGERLFELIQMTQPKAQTISDMPRGGGERKNAIEEYIIKSEELQKELADKHGLLDAKWDEFCEIAVKSGITVAQKTMIYNRFYLSFPWKMCVETMKRQYPDTKWNEQKLFRMYRKVLCKIDRRAEKDL